MTLAAAELGLTQSAISHRLKRLEAFVGAPLLNRTGVGLLPTPAGTTLAEGLGRMLDEMAELRARSRATVQPATLKIGLGSALANYWLVRRLPAFASAHPGVAIELLIIESDVQARALDLDVQIRWIPKASARATSTQRLLFNERMPGDTTRPHPLFADPEVRHALSLGIDRATATKAIFGKYAALASSPAAPGAWFGGLAPSPVEFDPKRASRILAGRGWKDSDGDGVLDRNGVALAFNLIVPSSSESRKQLALIIQDQLKRLGVRVEVVPIEVTQFFARRPPGDFDASLESYGGDPAPWSLLDRWGCGAAANYGRYCNRTADSLLRAAHLAQRDPAPPIRAWLRTLAADHPAVFLFAADRVYVIPKYYNNVSFQIESPWQRVWTWTLAGTSR